MQSDGNCLHLHAALVLHRIRAVHGVRCALVAMVTTIAVMGKLLELQLGQLVLRQLGRLCGPKIYKKT